MHPLVAGGKEKFDENVISLTKDLSNIRAGQASPSLVENLQVVAYGVKTPLKQLAAITVPEARMIVIQPWDKNIAKDIERAIQESTLGMTPVVEGIIIRLTIPALTEEKRKELLRDIGKRVEEARIRIRMIRDSVREKIVSMERGKELTEDDKYMLFKVLDEMTKDFGRKIDEMVKKKEEEVMTV